MENIKRFLKDESGQGLVEYGLLIGILVIGAIGAVGLLGLTVKEVFYDKIIKNLTDIVSDF